MSLEYEPSSKLLPISAEAVVLRLKTVLSGTGMAHYKAAYEAAFRFADPQL
jgi:hypothetical protein